MTVRPMRKNTPEKSVYQEKKEKGRRDFERKKSQANMDYIIKEGMRMMEGGAKTTPKSSRLTPRNKPTVDPQTVKQKHQMGMRSRMRGKVKVPKGGRG